MAIVTAVGFDELDLVIDDRQYDLTGPSGQSFVGIQSSRYEETVRATFSF